MPRTTLLYQKQNQDFSLLVKQKLAGRKNVTQLAASVGVSPPTMYNRIEHPERFTVGELREVIRVTGITPDQAASLLFK